MSNANSIIQGAADNSSHGPREELPLCYPGCEMRFREIRCDGFRNSINSWGTTASPKRDRNKEGVHLYKAWADICTSLQGKEDKLCPW